MNAKKIIGYALALIGIAVAGNIGLYIFGQSPFNFAKIYEERTVQAGHITDIQVSSNAGEVRVIPHDGNAIEIRMEGTTEKRWAEDYTLSVREMTNQLVIEATEIQRTRLFSIYGGRYTVTVALPRQQFDRLQVDTGAANIVVANVQVEQSVLHTALGNIDVTELTGSVHGETEVGDIKLHYEEILHDVVAVTALGNITVTAEAAPVAVQTDISSSLGKETVTLPLTSNGSDAAGAPLVKLSTEVGDVSLLAAGE